MGTANAAQLNITKLMAQLTEIQQQLPGWVAAQIKAKGEAASLEEALARAGVEANALHDVASSVARHLYGVAKRALAELGEKAKDITPAEFVGRLFEAVYQHISADGVAWLESDPEGADVPAAKPGAVTKATGHTTLQFLKASTRPEAGLASFVHPSEGEVDRAHRKAHRESALPAAQQPQLKDI